MTAAERPDMAGPRLRAEFVGGAAAALTCLRHVAMEADRRAADLAALKARLPEPRGRAGELLAVLVRDLDAVAKAACRALGDVEGVSLAEVAGMIGGDS